MLTNAQRAESFHAGDEPPRRGTGACKAPDRWSVQIGRFRPAKPSSPVPDETVRPAEGRVRGSVRQRAIPKCGSGDPGPQGSRGVSRNRWRPCRWRRAGRRRAVGCRPVQTGRSRFPGMRAGLP